MKKILAIVFLFAASFATWFGYNLTAGKPNNFDHFAERIMVKIAMADPELLTAIGSVDNTWMDFHSSKLAKSDPEMRERMLTQAMRHLELLGKYDKKDLTEQQNITYDFLEWLFTIHLQTQQFPYHAENAYSYESLMNMSPYPINHLMSRQIMLPHFMETDHRIENKKSARNYVARVGQFDQAFTDLIERMKAHEKMGVIPPRFALEYALKGVKKFQEEELENNVLFTNFKSKLAHAEGLDDAERFILYTDLRKEMTRSVQPAYAKLTAYLEDLIPRAKDAAGVWSLPSGDAYYRFMLKYHTTTDMSPEEIHQLGLSEVARIQGEMRRILNAQGITGKSIAAHMQDLNNDRRFLYANTSEGKKEMLRDFEILLAKMEEKLPSIFNNIPEGKINIEVVPEHMAQTAPMAYYYPASFDQKRKGTFYINQHNTDNCPKFAMPALAFHEGLPGHHFQIQLQNEIKGLPSLRRLQHFNAFAEGWALYTERLAWENGFMEDPFDNLGRLQLELMRAVRLVVDTGIHYKRWTREEGIKYMLTEAGLPQEEAVAEVERYIIWPGQACSYKVGMEKILTLRERAKSKLGSKFDIKQFHDVVLGNGSLPLNMLESIVDRYIEKEL